MTPNGFAPDELQDALQPIASLISKSEKAQQKLAPGTWQHVMLRDNLRALYIAHDLMRGMTAEANSLTRDELEALLRAMASMKGKTGEAQTRFLPGTSQHSLLRNRLKALCIAESLIRETADKRNV